MKEITKNGWWKNISTKTTVAAPLLLLNLLAVVVYIKMFVKFECLLYVENAGPLSARPGFPYRQRKWYSEFNQICVDPTTPPNLFITILVLAVSSLLSYFLIFNLLKNRASKKGKDFELPQLEDKALVITLSLLMLLVFFYVFQLLTIRSLPFF